MNLTLEVKKQETETTGNHEVEVIPDEATNRIHKSEKPQEAGFCVCTIIVSVEDNYRLDIKKSHMICFKPLN